MTTVHDDFTTARAGEEPNKPSSEATFIYSAIACETPRRDIDLFGPTTVRIDLQTALGQPGVPILYLSAYVEDPERLAKRVIGGLAWLGDSQTAQAAHDAVGKTPAAPVAPLYAMPEFVEDVDWHERLALAEPPSMTNWEAWTKAMMRRIRLAVTARQLASLEAANTIGMQVVPRRGPLVAAFNRAHEDCADQSAAA